MEQHGFRRGPYDDSERRKWQDPDAVLSAIGLEPGNTFADIGCGGGFFTLAAARKVGASGRVYGLDVNAGLIEVVRRQAEAEGLSNLCLTVGRAEETVVCERCADIVFFGIALHDFQEPARVLENAGKILRPAGRLVNLDWKKEPMELGPPLSIRFGVEKATRLIKEAGFKVEATRDSGLYHYLVIARL